MVKVRMHRGTLAESMETASEVADFAELVEYLSEQLAPDAVRYIDVVEVRRCWTNNNEPMPDQRIGWKDTWLICINGEARGMADGPVIAGRPVYKAAANNPKPAP